jgi:hypothetical protein
MSIPVWKKGLGLQMISKVKICNEVLWQKKHLASLQQAYRHAPYCDEHLGIFERQFSPDQKNILDMNMEIMAYVLGALGCTTRIIRLSEIGIKEKGTALIVDICLALGASRYLAQDSATKWLDSVLFEQAGIEMEFHKPPIPIYPQLWGPFISNLSIFDLLFTCGPKTREIIRH